MNLSQVAGGGRLLRSAIFAPEEALVLEELCKDTAFFQQLAAVLLVAALIAGMCLALSGRETAVPKNPLLARAMDSSHILQQETLTITPDLQQSPGDAPPSPTPESSSTPEPTPTPKATATPAPSQSATSQSTQTPVPSATRRPGKPSPTRQPSPIITPRPDENPSAEPTAG